MMTRAIRAKSWGGLARRREQWREARRELTLTRAAPYNPRNTESTRTKEKDGKEGGRQPPRPLVSINLPCCMYHLKRNQSRPCNHSQ